MSSTSVRTSKVDRGAWVAGSITVLFWSSAFTAINVGLTGYAPTHLTLLRFAIASLFFVVLGWAVRMPRPERKDIGRLFVTGLCGITIYHSALNLGQLYVPAGTAGLIIGTAPIFTALLSYRYLGETLHRWGWVAIGVSFAGLGVILLGHGESVRFTAGALLILLAALIGSAYFVLVKSLVARYSSLQVTAYVTWAGTLPLLVFSPGLIQAIRHAPREATLATVYSGIFPAAIAYLTWGIALAKAPASRVAPLLFISPILGMGVAWFWIGEVPTPAALLGGAIALGGVIMLQRSAPPSPAPPTQRGP